MTSMAPTSLDSLIQRYRTDAESVYHTWFLGEDRLKAFWTIRRGVQQVVEDILLAFSDLEANCEALCRFGATPDAIAKIAKAV